MLKYPGNRSITVNQVVYADVEVPALTLVKNLV